MVACKGCGGGSAVVQRWCLAEGSGWWGGLGWDGEVVVGLPAPKGGKEGCEGRRKRGLLGVRTGLGGPDWARLIARAFQWTRWAC